MSFNLAFFQYELPEELIAQTPAARRDGSRLLELKEGRVTHRYFKDLASIVGPNDIFVANNTRVMAGRFFGERILPGNKSGGKVEVVLLEPGDLAAPLETQKEFVCLMRSGGKQIPGFRVKLTSRTGVEFSGELIAEGFMRFDCAPFAVGGGLLPLPPYIERSAEDADLERYQTVYSKETGSAAAPTAGLHFTDTIKSDLQKKGAEWLELTLHVGVGTFRPVKVDDIRQHEMHSEWFDLSQQTAEKLTAFRRQGKRVTAVGTTSARVLETCWDRKASAYMPRTERTSIFIYPGCRPAGEREVAGFDSLITNFHLPGSTLLMLVCAFAPFGPITHVQVGCLPASD